MKTLLTSVAVSAVGVGLGWAAIKYHLNAFLESNLPGALSDVPIQLALVVLFGFYVNSFLGFNTSLVRSKYKIQAPITYPTEKDLPKNEQRIAFLSTVRGHENYLEAAPQIYFVFLIHFVLKTYLTTAFVLMMVFFVARVIYAEAYQISPSMRTIGYVPAFFATLALHGLLFWTVVQKLGLPTYT